MGLEASYTYVGFLFPGLNIKHQKPSVYSILYLIIELSLTISPFFFISSRPMNLGLLSREHLPEADFHLECMDEDLNELFDSGRRLQLNVLLQ